MLSDGEDLTYMESALKTTEMKQIANKITLAALNKLYSRKYNVLFLVQITSSLKQHATKQSLVVLRC